MAQGVSRNRTTPADLILSPPLGPYELALVDIDPAALEVALKLSQMLINRADANVRLSGAVNRKDVLPGADYVLTTIEYEREIP